MAAAKRRVYGIVDIDMIAGPSEILVLADAAANPAYVAADLLSQAEHDRLATAVLVCDSEALAGAVSAELERQIPLLPRADIARASIDNNGKIIIARDMAEGVDIANEIAPEHLEVCVDDPFSLLNSIRNAGSIFLGKNVPEALGDYFAGPNHTLPTLGTARFSSPLSVDDFVKKSSFIYYTKEALGAVQERIVDFAEREGAFRSRAAACPSGFEDGSKTKQRGKANGVYCVHRDGACGLCGGKPAGELAELARCGRSFRRCGSGGVHSSGAAA